jgi:hypothetical protein
MSPANFVHKWSTPQMLIHGSKDYRLAETESIGAFHALQQCVSLAHLDSTLTDFSLFKAWDPESFGHLP